jgi:polar amino acid transport system substrate-binding protein
VDRKGHRVVVGRNSAYDLFLTRNLKQAEIVRTPTSATVVEVFMKENYDVAAGVKQQLMNDAKRVPGVRLLPGRFMVINQAMASQRGKEAGARYVREFVEEMKASGFVAKALERHQQTATVAPPGL